MYRPSFFQFMVHCLMQSSFSSVLPLTVYFVFQDRFCSVYIPLVCLVIMQLLEQFPVDHLFQSCLLFFFSFRANLLLSLIYGSLPHLPFRLHSLFSCCFFSVGFYIIVFPYDLTSGFTFIIWIVLVNVYLLSFLFIPVPLLQGRRNS